MSILPDFSTEDLKKRKSDLEGYLEKAKYKGNKKDVKGISLLINEVDREIADREEGVSSEIAAFGRNITRGATLGMVDDDTFAKVRSIGDIFETEDQAKDIIAQQRRLTKDNSGLEMGSEFLGTAATAVMNSRLVGAGATKLATFGRQGALAMAESLPYSYRNLESSKQWAQNQDFIDGLDELGYMDFVKEVNQLVLNGVIGGGLGAVTMRNATDWASTRSSKDYVATKEGAKTQADDLADEELDQVTRVALANRPVMEEAFENARDMRQYINDAESGRPSRSAPPSVPPSTNAMRAFGSDPLNPKPPPEPPKPQPSSTGVMESKVRDIRGLEDDLRSLETELGLNKSGAFRGGDIKALQAQVNDLKKVIAKEKDDLYEMSRGNDGMGQNAFSVLDEKPWVNRKTEQQLRDQQKSWRDASTAGELVDAVTRGFKNFNKDKIFGLDNRLQWDVSRELGGRFQVAQERTVRSITQELKEFVEPAQRVFDLNVKDTHLQALLLDFANDSPQARSKIRMERVKSYITEKLSAKDADAFENYYQWSKRNSVDALEAYSGVRNEDILTNQYLHTRLTPAAKERKGIEVSEFDDLELPVDPGTLKRNRNFYFNQTSQLPGGAPVPSDYLPVLQTDLRRVVNNRLAINLSEQFDMPKMQGNVSPEQWLKFMENTLIKKGIHGEGANYATKHIKDHMIGVNRSPELWIQAFNSFGYMGSLAGPKSAMLNLHDPAMATVNFNVPLSEMPGALMRAFKNKAGADVMESGIDQNVGEFLNTHTNQVTRMQTSPGMSQKWWADSTRELTDKMMKWSQFQRTDIYSKNATLNVILEQLVREAKTGKINQNWGFYLKPTDMNKLAVALKKNGADFKKYKGKDFELVEDLAFAALGQQQLISASGRSSAWARNPNLRPLWALRGFASKQQGILMWKVVENFRKGNAKEAYKYLGMYAAVVGTSYGVLNESRQWLFGDGNWDLTGVFMGMADQMLSTASVNTLGLNDYQWGRINEVGVLRAFAESLVPIAVDIPFETGRDIVDTLSGKQGPLYPIAQFPLVKQPIQFGQNMIENVAQNVDQATFGNVDIRPVVKDPQELVLQKMGMLKQYE